MWRQKSYTDDTAPEGRRSLHRNYNPGAPFDIYLRITYAIGVGSGKQYLILEYEPTHHRKMENNKHRHVYREILNLDGKTNQPHRDYKAPFLAIVLRHKREAKKLYADAQCKLGDRMYSKRYDLIVLEFVYARRAS
ncbi:hypothetical protein KL942_003450 [Ogataea angusta]|uniref:Uncharacterized protein n=1 Tax=Pichia angusta TaxID=870730 RepID=A0ABQ7RWQ4_PICAN|nr:hypothetical protein KL942_003450 [Ogataea angusta]KAG7849472.1 hypothetical protein KL940_003154 [Ogataea angusta]